MRILKIVLLLGLLNSLNVCAQEAQKQYNPEGLTYHSIGTVLGFTIAAHDMPNMVEFYRKVFNVDFSEKTIQGFTLFEGEWLGLNLLICPADFARNTAQQTRHQLDIAVTDFDLIIENVQQFGGSLLGEVTIQEGIRSVGIHDPDQNSMIIMEAQK
jgi:predicted enzyme related to lactoylglutathione lyase